MDELNQSIAQIITDKFDAPVDEIIHTDIGDDNISGYLISGGEAYFYNLDDRNIKIQHSPALTENINEYARGVLDETGIEYHGDSEYAWAQGYFRMDAAVKCKSGGVPCGNICLPRGKKCRKGAGGAKLATGSTKSGRLGALRQVSRQIGTNPKLLKRQLEAAQKNLGKDFKTKMGMLGAGAGVVGAVALASHLMKGKKKPSEAEDIANEAINQNFNANRKPDAEPRKIEIEDEYEGLSPEQIASKASAKVMKKQTRQEPKPRRIEID